MRIVLTRTAEGDLRSIGRWIAKDNPPRAIGFVQELRNEIAGLAFMPRRFPVASEPDVRPAVHRMNHRGYRILYRVLDGDDVVEVLHVHHGARAYPPLA